MGVVKYIGVEKYLNDDGHKALFEAYAVDLINQMTAEQLKKWYEWYSGGTSNKEIPEHNIPDWDNDTIDVLKAKVLAIRDADKGWD